jgi:hypothetical protein
MKEFSPIGWVLIGAVVFIVLSTYWSLASMIRKKRHNHEQPLWTKSWHAVSHPFEAESRDLDRLSREVSNLVKSSSAEETEPPPEV